MLVKAHALTQSAMAELFRIRAIDIANTGAALKFNAITRAIRGAISRTCS